MEDPLGYQLGEGSVTHPQHDDLIAHLDFPLLCRSPRVLNQGEKCLQLATHLVEVHKVRACRHPSLVDGNSSGYVCTQHLHALERQVDKVVRRYNPGRLVRLWRPWPPLCPSCGSPIQHRGDVLQNVTVLP
jgi:hypothetical protein